MNLTHPDTATILFLVGSILIPGLASALQRAHWHPDLIALTALALAGADGFVSEWASHVGSYDWKNGLLLALLSYVVTVGARYQFWKGSVLDGKLLALGSKK